MDTELKSRKYWEDYFDCYENKYDGRILEYDAMVAMSKYFTGFTRSPCDKYDNFVFANKAMRFNTIQEMDDISKPMYENGDILMLYNCYSRKDDKSIIIRFENISTMGYIHKNHHLI